MKIVKNTEKVNESISKVSDKEAEQAFKTIIEWIGEDPNREGLIETPRRVLKAFKEYFQGYNQDSESELRKHLEMLKAMTIWYYKRIYQYQVIANIIWHPLSV